MSKPLKNPELPPGAIVENYPEGGARRNDGVTLTPASQNPWYVLATVAVSASHDIKDITQAIYEGNSRYWNGWMCQEMHETERAELAKKIGLTAADLAPLSAAETDAVKARFKRAFPEVEPESKIPNPEDRIDFSFTKFPFQGIFRNFCFTRPALFRAAYFEKSADFQSTCFVEGADFQKACFAKRVCFEKTRFTGFADFQGTLFSDHAVFSETRLTDIAYFDHVHFGGLVDFEKAHFSGPANFQDARFSDRASFREADFRDIASFHAVHFGEHAVFETAKFAESAFFQSTLFTRHAFSWMRLSKRARISRMAVSRRKRCSMGRRSKARCQNSFIAKCTKTPVLPMIQSSGRM